MRSHVSVLSLLVAGLLVLTNVEPAGSEILYFTHLRSEPIFKCSSESGEIRELTVALPTELAARVPEEAGAFGGRGRGSRGGRRGSSAPFMEIIALAADREHIYWIDNLRGLLLRADSEGKNVGLLLDLWEFMGEQESMANGMTLHNGRLIWTSVGPGRKVFSVGVNGDEPRLLVDIVATFGVRNQTPMSISVFDKHIFWIDPLQDGIYSAELDGSSPARVREAYGEGALAVTANGVYWPAGSLRIVRGGLGEESEPELILERPRDVHKLAAHGDKLYLTDSQGVHRANLDGSGVEDICAKSGTIVGFAPVF